MEWFHGSFLQGLALTYLLMKQSKQADDVWRKFYDEIVLDSRENSVIQVVILMRILLIFRLPSTIQFLCLWTNQVRVDNPACVLNTTTWSMSNKFIV